ncbi:AAA family ATPase [Actinoplanes sp. KI2]|uniref:AAA family ATPase n=1 Tax=Actinoplanes sp. KI2 TaxID=2983315 RepID=UPI0021D5A684|nr:AAA family ATPase [Actinoplanes sp. KI2]MCU7727582.1 AAA family ATPase [Actinoplanes sp. KI2]
MRAYILTGTPGSGKTAILRQLEADGHAVVEEAATDVIALGQALGDPRPWETAGFAERILDLQRRRRRIAEAYGAEVVFFDRSPVCTLALCRYAELPVPAGLLDAVDGYERTAFLVRNLGFVEPTAARRITFEQSIGFERIHERAYRELGFELVEVPPGALARRTELIETATRVRP